MKTFVRSFLVGALFLLLGLSTSIAQEVTFVPGPTVSVSTSGGVSGANGGFAWADLNGDGILDVFIPSNILFFNNVTSFAVAASTATVNIPVNNNSTGLLLADFNGDGVADLFTTNGGTPSAGLLYNNAGVFTAATGTGDLGSAGVTGEVFQGASAAPIDHSNYLSLCWPGTFTGIAGNSPVPGGGGMWLLKGGPNGFTNVGRGAGTTSANVIQNFESDQVGTSYSHIGWSATDITAIDTLDPLGGTNKCMKVKVNNYNAAPVLAFTLPAGKKLSDYSKFIFRGYWAQGDVGYKDIVVEASQTMPTGHALDASTTTALGKWNRALMGSTAWETDTVSITNTSSFSGTVYIDFGINCAGTGNVGGTGVQTQWYADDITLVSPTGIPVSNLAIDTTLSFESWDVRFLDANNDGYLDLLMPSFRNGFSRVDTGSSGARKGCVLFLNDGTGKFIVPTGASLGRTIYSVGVGGILQTTPDTGIIVDDIVRHFSAIGEQWGDLNNDGIEDLVLNGLGATDNLDGNGTYVADIILYGKGDGTFTYKWDGVHVVANNGLTQNTAQRSISIGDYNNDGWADIYTAHTFGPQHLYRNNGDGTFTDMATQDALSTGGARAAQLVDYTNDGFLDIFMYTGGAASLQKNNGNSNRWIGFMPIGTGHNMSAIGAKFTVWTGGKQQIRVISAEGGSAGMGGTLRANFGLGTATKVDSVNVQWPDGTKQTFNFGAANNTLAVSKFYKIVEGSVIPAAPVLKLPADNATNLPAKNTLVWSKAAGALSYELQVGTNIAFGTGQVLLDVLSLTDTSTTQRLGLATKYYWRVRGWSGDLQGPWAAVDSFSTNMTPATTVPKLLSPASNAIAQPIKPTLKCGSTPEASTYHFQVRSDMSFSSTTGFILNDSVNVIDTTVTLGPPVTAALTPAAKYYWRVRAWNRAGASTFTSPDSFTIMFLPATPVLAYPASNAANVPVNLTFKWRRVAGDSNYVVQFWTSAVQGVVLTSDTTKHDSSLAVTSLLNRSKYYWKVMTFNQAGASAFTNPDSFTTVIEAPIAPALVSPRAPTVPGRRTIFVWNPALNATKYHLQVATANFPTTSIVEDIMVEDTTARIADTLAANTSYFWHVSSLNLGGESPFSGTARFTTGTAVGVHELAGDIPKEFALLQNFPNPFNPTTEIRYDIPKTAYVSLKIYDVLGRVVATLVDGVQSASSYMVQWNPSGLSSGVYFYRVQARNQDGSGDFVAVKKLLFMK
jgi:hypothetical protein